MPLSLTRANRIFAKAGLTCHLRKATDAERHAGFAWVLDQGAEPATHGWPTLNDAIVAVVDAAGPDFHAAALTPVERSELVAVERHVNRHLLAATQRSTHAPTHHR